MGGKRRANILVVDDTPGKLAALGAILEPLQQTVVTATSGREALRILLRQDFALILLDVRMADMDGFETAALIRQRRASEHTPIIFLTAFEQAELDMARGYSLGAVDFIFSPIVPEVLRAKAAVFVDLHHKTEEVRELYAEAQESSRSKSEFLNMAAHELRTPLSVVSGYLALMKEGSLGTPPSGWEMPLDMLSTKATELNRIVDDLLLASRMDVNALGDQRLVFDLRECAEAAIKRAEPRSLLLKADVNLTAGPEPVLVEADTDLVGRILDNLINNALTYCTQTPKIAVAVGGEGQASVSISDNGIGIPLEKAELVFERFVRLDDDLLGPVAGTGLGLYISRELARRYGGSLVLEQSLPKQGSTFTLRMPAHPAANGRPSLHVHGGAGDSGGTQDPSLPGAASRR